MDLTNSNGNVRSSRLDIPRGLFVLRYVDREISGAPVITVRPLPGSERFLTFAHHPDLSPTVLDRPGTLVVVSSLGNASVQISAQARTFGGSLEARVDLEPLVKAPVRERDHDDTIKLPGVVNKDTEIAWSPADNAEIGLSILGHVARRGDVLVQGGGWIAGPEAPSPVEGLEIRVNSSARSWFESQVLVSGEANWSAWRAPGQFLGSRGQARPLVGIRIRTTHNAPLGLSVDAAALFLGSPVLRCAGTNVELRSPAGNDPIVGLQLGVVLARQESQSSENGAGVLYPARRGKVRVFRANS